MHRALLEGKDESFDRLLMKEEENSLSKTQEKLLFNKRECREQSEARIQINLQHLQNDEGVFGHCKIASGYRVANGHALDWAIGEPLPERTGTNEVRPRAKQH